MPNRIIKESICYSDDIDKLTWFEEVVFYRLIVRCDDNGRLDARPAFLRSMLFATRQGVTDKSIHDAVRKLASIGLVFLYEVEEKPFLLFPKWGLHQRIRNIRGKYPPPADVLLPQSAASCRNLRPESESQSQSESESISNPNKSAPTRACLPTVEEVSHYCNERKNTVDPDTFVDFYAAKGWKVGSQPMKDWKAAVRTWERRQPNARHGSKMPEGEASRRVRDDLERMRDFLDREREGGHGA